jgi:hypothetical protein
MRRIIGAVAVALAACGSTGATSQPSPAAPPRLMSGTHAHANPALTPGVVDYRQTTDSLCHKKLPDRTVTAAQKNRVYAKYGIAVAARKWYVLDDLLPREVGGLNAEANLWPEPKLEAQSKDRVEDQMHRDICAERITIPQALDYFRKEWG